jgi:dTDP-glucose pyrophosphorylase
MDSIRKVVVLAAGKGTRMRSRREDVHLSGRQAEVADTGIKALIPVGRPFLDFVLAGVADAGYREVCLVIGPRHDELRERYSQSGDERLRLAFAVQHQPQGTAHALLSAGSFVGSDEFLLINSDNYYPISALYALRTLSQPGLVGFDARALTEKGNIPAERVTNYAIVQSDESGYLSNIVEKPDPLHVRVEQDRRLVSMNCWRFGPSIWEACGAIKKSSRGEFELPDAVEYSMLELGQRYRVVTSHEPVLDLSCRGDIESVARLLQGVEVKW